MAKAMLAVRGKSSGKVCGSNVIARSARLPAGRPGRGPVPKWVSPSRATRPSTAFFTRAAYKERKTLESLAGKGTGAGAAGGVGAVPEVFAGTHAHQPLVFPVVRVAPRFAPCYLAPQPLPFLGRRAGRWSQQDPVLGTSIVRWLSRRCELAGRL